MEIGVSRTIKFAKAGGPDVLEFIEAQLPAPGPHEVRIKVKAIGINRADSMWRNDKYVEPVKSPPVWDTKLPVLSRPWAKTLLILPWMMPSARFLPSR
jgi:NADPH:quinone reductase-like Zn-dependent oxidoreductase